jgi:hypothetical protein
VGETLDRLTTADTIDIERKNMSRTIEAIIGGIMRTRGDAIPTQPKQLTAIWQNGLESGGRVQRKLRLGFTTAATQRAAN